MTRMRSATLSYGTSPEVNLLPSAERRRRDHAALIRRWGLAALAAVLVVILAVAAGSLWERATEHDLRQEQARTTQLAGQVASYQDVVTATRNQSSYEAYRSQAMANDTTWRRVIGALQAALPRAASIAGFDATVGTDTSAPGSASGTGTTDGPAVTAPPGTTVTVQVRVSTRSSGDQSSVVAAVGRVPGVLGVQLTSLATPSKGTVSGAITVFFDDSVLSAKYGKAAR